MWWFSRKGKRVVLLVTAPLGKSFRAIVKAIGREPSPCRWVDWSNCDNRALPHPQSCIKFTTHYALCVIDRDIWDSTSINLFDKFRTAKFWDHPGDGTFLGSSMSISGMRLLGRNAGVAWSDDQIAKIDGGMEIGRTDVYDEDITQTYAGLLQDWVYTPIFWNCHDLAIRLAHLIVKPSQTVTQSLRSLMFSLQEAYNREIDLGATAGRTLVSGAGAAVLGGLLGGPVGWAGAGMLAAGAGMMFKEGDDRMKRLDSMRLVEWRFPELASLHYGA